jgi:hypothetical protein
MTRNGGGWTLVLTSTHSGWTAAEVLSMNGGSPSLGNDYSILKDADAIKGSSGASANFEYRIEASERGRYGGIWSAPSSYSFVKTDNSQTNVEMTTQFDSYTYPSDEGIEKRMPWADPGGCAGLTTSDGRSGGCNMWWGTMVTKSGWGTAGPWLGDAMQSPPVFWYWVREAAPGATLAPTPAPTPATDPFWIEHPNKDMGGSDIKSLPCANLDAARVIAASELDPSNPDVFAAYGANRQRIWIKNGAETNTPHDSA